MQLRPDSEIRSGFLGKQLKKLATMKNLPQFALKAIKKANNTQERIGLLLADIEDTPLQMKERESELFTINAPNGDFITNY